VNRSEKRRRRESYRGQWKSCVPRFQCRLGSAGRAAAPLKCYTKAKRECVISHQLSNTRMLLATCGTWRRHADEGCSNTCVCGVDAESAAGKAPHASPRMHTSAFARTTDRLTCALQMGQALPAPFASSSCLEQSAQTARWPQGMNTCGEDVGKSRRHTLSLYFSKPTRQLVRNVCGKNQSKQGPQITSRSAGAMHTLHSRSWRCCIWAGALVVGHIAGGWGGALGRGWRSAWNWKQETGIRNCQSQKVRAPTQQPSDACTLAFPAYHSINSIPQHQQIFKPPCTHPTGSAAVPLCC